MIKRCADLDEFFDGELAADQADVFREHLATCERCQRVLHGRMQENVAARVSVPRLERTVASPAVTPAATGCATPPGGHRFRRFRRALVYAAPVLAAAAVLPLWLAQRTDPGFEMSLAITPAKQARRGTAAHVGDVVRPSVRGEPYRAIWVYLDDRELVLRCPEDDRCNNAGSELAVELPLTARGRYAVIAVGSREPIAAPGKTLDETLAASRTTGVHTQVAYVDVD